MQSRVQKNPNSELVARYVIEQCSMRHGALWLGSRASSDPIGDMESQKFSAEWLGEKVNLSDRLRERLAGATNFADLIRRFQLKGVREDSRQGLLGWLENRYLLHLTYAPPTPEQLLGLQVRGERVVTLHLDDRGPIGRHAGPFEFLLHDLEHAHKFFGDRSFRGQQRFFKLLSDALEAGIFTSLCQENAQFRGELDYLMADMNSHPLHLLKYLKAIVLEALPDKSVATLDRWCDDLFAIWRLPEPVKEAARRINYPPLENNEARLRVSDFFTYSERP